MSERGSDSNGYGYSNLRILSSPVVIVFLYIKEVEEDRWAVLTCSSMCGVLLLFR